MGAFMDLYHFDVTLPHKGDMDIQMEHPYKMMTCAHIDLEKYVLFMQVRYLSAVILG